MKLDDYFLQIQNTKKTQYQFRSYRFENRSFGIDRLHIPFSFMLLFLFMKMFLWFEKRAKSVQKLFEDSLKFKQFMYYFSREFIYFSEIQSWNSIFVCRMREKKTNFSDKYFSVILWAYYLNPIYRANAMILHIMLWTDLKHFETVCSSVDKHMWKFFFREHWKNRFQVGDKKKIREHFHVNNHGE